MQAAYSSVQVRSLEKIHMSSGHANQTELVYYMTFISDDITALRKQVSHFLGGKIVVVVYLNFCYYRLNA